MAHLTTVHSAYDSRILERECRTLAAAGCRVTLIAPHERDERVGGVQIVGLPRPSGRAARWTRTVPACHRAAVATGAELFHLHDPELLPLGLLLRRGGARVVADLHEHLSKDLRSKEWIPRPLRGFASLGAGLCERLLAGGMSHLIAATPDIARQFPESRVTVVANYPLLEDLSAASRSPYEHRPARVLYAGELSARRGSLSMARAAELLAARERAEIVVMGRFASASEEAAARREPGWRRVNYLGVRRWAEVADAIATSRVGLLLYHPAPNHEEAWPRKLFEYLAGGLPVVFSDLPGWRRLLDDVGCGIAVDPADPTRVADAVAWLLAHEREAREMGERGRRAAVERFNWSSQGERLLDLYRRLLARETDRRPESRRSRSRERSGRS